MRLPSVFSTGLLVFCLAFSTAAPLQAADWYVAPGGAGTGTASAPFGKIQDGLNAAQPGDVVHLRPGTYQEVLRTVRNGSASTRITVRAASGRGSVLVTMSGRVLTVSHAYVTVEGLVLDGQFGTSDLVRIETAGHGFTLRDSEVRRTSRDAIDMGAPHDVLIEKSLIHHALNAADGRTDAHGIVAGAVRRLTIRDTEIHTFSGDGVQVDPGRAAPGWSDVTIEGCRIWLAPLPTAVNGFAAGTVPGENALDTKAAAGNPRATITVRDTVAFGYRGGLISNMAAFNLKEHIDAVMDRVTVYDSEIAFRMRGAGANSTGAEVLVQNSVVYDTATAFRYEDDIQKTRLYNVTVGRGVTRAFQAASSTNSVLDVRNFLLLGSSLPAQAAGGSNLAVPASAFVNATQHNYQLADGSPAVDAGETLAGVLYDRQGTARPQGPAYDVGVYERPATTAPSTGGEVVLHAWKAADVRGHWAMVADQTAAGGARMASPDEGQPAFKSVTLLNALHYFELTFNAEAGRPYRLWIRGRAENDSTANDSVYVQFSNTVDALGTPVFRIGSKSASTITLKYCSSRTCNPSAWGWRDNSMQYVEPTLFYFATSGPQTLRILTREDGMSIDQVVLSSSDYLGTAAGPMQNDTTILPPKGW
ncbi:MAG: hypothetical protein H0X67_12040 [Acidobacteria bacterium]|nr:hypothetical protein [Acidobacteriota bacterium]